MISFLLTNHYYNPWLTLNISDFDIITIIGTDNDKERGKFFLSYSVCYFNDNWPPFVTLMHGLWG